MPPDGGAAREGGLRVGLFGPFDCGDVGQVALRRILDAELSARLDGVRVVTLAPFGIERPLATDDGVAARPVPRLGADREGADGLGCDVLVIAGDSVGDDSAWAARYGGAGAVGAARGEIAARGITALCTSGRRGRAPAAPLVTWFAVGVAPGLAAEVAAEARVAIVSAGGSVRDAASRRRLAVGGEPPVAVGDPLVLFDRAARTDVLGRREDLLRLCGVLAPGRRLVVGLDGGDAPEPRALAAVSAAARSALRRFPDLAVVVVRQRLPAASAAGTGRSAPPRLEVTGPEADRVHQLPVWAGLDDVAAILASATGVLADTPALAHLAASLGAPVLAAGHLDDGYERWARPVPWDELHLAVEGLLTDRPVPDLDGARRALEEALDGLTRRIAEHVPASASVPDPRLDAVDAAQLLRALEILQRRLVDERTALQAEVSRLGAALERMSRSPEHRIVEPARRAYRAWRHGRT